LGQNVPFGCPVKANSKESTLKTTDHNLSLLYSDLISLGINSHDTHPTPFPVTTAQVTAETYPVERHERAVGASGFGADTVTGMLSANAVIHKFFDAEKIRKGVFLWDNVRGAGVT
jgi:hypothetical protein